MVVAAAGNDGQRRTSVADPAYDPRILAVGAFDPTTASRTDSWTLVADFTNSGSTSAAADVFAPGMHIVSLRDPGSYVDTQLPEERRSATGSRAAAARRRRPRSRPGFVADLFQRYPNATPDQIKNVLVRSRRRQGLAAHQAARHRRATGSVNGAKALARSIRATDNGRQDFPSANGTGSLEAARGDVHLSTVTSELTGEQDIFGNAWDGRRWSAGGVERHELERRAVERAALERRRLGRPALVERHLDGDDWAGTLERPAVVGCAVVRRSGVVVGRRWSGRRWSATAGTGHAGAAALVGDRAAVGDGRSLRSRPVDSSGTTPEMDDVADRADGDGHPTSPVVAVRRTSLALPPRDRGLPRGRARTSSRCPRRSASRGSRWPRASRSPTFAVHVEIGDDAHSFTLNEVPLIIGLFLCTPERHRARRACWARSSCSRSCSASGR